MGFEFFLLLEPLAFICFVFFVGCFLFDYSTQLLQCWKQNIHMENVRGYRKSLIFKLLKSLRIVAFPAEYVGIIDQDIKINFYAFLVDYVSTILSTLQDFL